MKKLTRTQLCLIALAGILSTVVLSVAFGARMIHMNDIIQAIVYGKQETIGQIVVHERIPRTLFGLIAGSALGVSGALMQSITRNPIADPSILGVNTGAALFVVCGMAFFNMHTANQFIFMALAGAGITAIFVYIVGSMGAGGVTPIKLALAGAATSAALSSLVSAVLLPRTEVMNTFRFWQVGSISGASWEGILSVLPFIACGMVLAVLILSPLDVMVLGDDMAIGLGVKTGPVRCVGAVAGVLLCGAVTALTGPIGFVGLMVPHLIRMVFGPSLKRLFPLTAVGGAVLLTLADVAGRFLGGGGELEAGLITAFLGAPVLIIIARKTKVHTL